MHPTYHSFTMQNEQKHSTKVPCIDMYHDFDFFHPTLYVTIDRVIYRIPVQLNNHLLPANF